VRVRVSDDVAVLQLPSNTVNQLVRTADDDLVVIDLTTLEDIEMVTIPRAAVRTIAAAGAGFEIQLAQGAIAFDAEAARNLGNAARTNNINMTINPLEELADGYVLPAELATDIEILEISIESGNQLLNELSGTITITIPYEGELPVGIWLLDDEGNAVYIEAEFDEELGVLVFETSELGVFVIGALTDEAPADAPTITPIAEPIIAEPIAATIAPPILRIAIGSAVYERNGIMGVSDSAPFIQEDRTMVPLRLVGEALGATIGWDEATQTVTITTGGSSISLTIGQPLPGDMGTPVIANDRPFVPIRYISEMLGANVGWDEATASVYLY
jgi:hypothetical protein